MGRFTIQLFESERAALVQLAEREHRAPRDQAALIIRHTLQRRGFLPRSPQPSTRVRLRAPANVAPRAEA